MTDAELAAIVGIGHDRSILNAEDLSMEKALRHSRYRDLRGELSHESLAAALRVSPQAVEQWVLYSQDKRTNRGWALEPGACRIHRPDHPNSSYTFANLADTVAAYILHELDYWSGRATEWR